MTISLEYQTVYGRSRRSASLSLRIAATLLLLVALVTKIWIRLETTRLGYELAQERKQTNELDMRLRELTLQRSILLRSDYLAREAAALGLKPLAPEHARRIFYERRK